MSARAINLQLDLREASVARFETYTYDRNQVGFDSMAEQVYFDFESEFARLSTSLTPDQARVLANQLLQVADTADEARARRESYERIREDLDRTDEAGTGIGCYLVHPDVHYAATQEEAAEKMASIKFGTVIVDAEMAGAA